MLHKKNSLYDRCIKTNRSFLSHTDPFGRKLAIILSSIIFIVGGILQAVAQNLPTMLAGRFIAGCKFLLLIYTVIGIFYQSA